jgi:hypothetical protein
LRLAALGAAALLSSGPAQAANLLSNGDFNQPLSGFWTTWTWGGGWANRETHANGYDSSYHIACGGNANAGGGVYQTVPATPGVPYTLTVDSEGDAWWKAYGEMRLIFMDSTNGVVMQTNKATVNAVAYDVLWPWSNYTLVATAPLRSTQVKVEFAEPNGTGTVRFDNAVLTAPIIPPVITNVYPDGSVLLQLTNTLAFEATSLTTTINAGGIQLVLNGVDVSAGLTVSGTDQDKKATYPLQSNLSYTAVITVTDTAGVGASKTVVFDTYSPNNFTWEAEDYDFNGGGFFDNPGLPSTASTPANSYYNTTGAIGTDYYDSAGDGGHDYRPLDYMSTSVTADKLKPNYAAAQLTDATIQDYQIGYFNSGEWLNFTRTYPTGKYNVYARLSAGNGAASLTLSQVTNNVVTNNLGMFSLTAYNWSSWVYVPLADSFGNPVAVTLGGVTTLRLTTAGGANVNFLMLVPVASDVPVVSGAYPDGQRLFQATNKFAFNILSPGIALNDSAIKLTLNGSNVTSQLTITGIATSKSVTFAGLQSNTTYTAVISATNVNGGAVTNTIAFDTFNPSYTWEAEDWDYNSGSFLANPVPLDGYAGLSGVEGVDYHDNNNGGNMVYRSETMATDAGSDTPRTAYVNAAATDYVVGYFVSNSTGGAEWVNYTRQFPAGNYNVYARLSTSGNSTLRMSEVTSGVGTSSQTLKTIGAFSATGSSWSTFSYVPLRDAFGNLGVVSLSGNKTFRMTRAGGADANMNFFMLVPARTDLPTLTAAGPSGYLQSTNKVWFTASSAAGINTNNIRAIVNGQDVSSKLSFTGSSTSWSVVLAGVLAPSTSYTVALSFTDNNGLSASTTLTFDTFTPAFTWEAEDWDYDSGKYYDNPQTNLYANLLGVDGVDFHDVSATGTNPYRGSGNADATEVCGDFTRPQYNGTGYVDYDVGYTATDEWENYTRTYPAGTYNVYLRAARGTTGNAVMGLSKVTSGQGTANQTTTSLGSFTVGNTGAWQTYQWIPLVDASSNLVSVTLGGVSTLRFTDGGANLNFFALVPALVLNSSVSGNQLHLSFTTQAGFNYIVEYKASLSDSAWTALPGGPVAGDGSSKTVTDASTGTARFYRLHLK